MRELKTSANTMYIVLVGKIFGKIFDANKGDLTLLRRGVTSLRTAIKYMQSWEETYENTSYIEQHYLVMKVLKVATALMLDINILLREHALGLGILGDAAFNIERLTAKFLPNYMDSSTTFSYLRNVPDIYIEGDQHVKIHPPRAILIEYEPPLSPFGNSIRHTLSPFVHSG